MTRFTTRVSRKVLSFLLIAALSACAGGAPSPEADPAPSELPAGTTMDPEAPQVEIYAGSQRLVIDQFRIDFLEMRNIYALIGFYPDQWETMERVPLNAISEFEFRGVVDDGTFERIFKNREDFQLRQQEIFKVFVRMVDGDAFDYYAIIPRIRGFKDGQRWEQPMGGNPLAVDRITIRQSG